jgi:tRNA(Ile)-lysidine synthase TilS/MesJ
LEDCAEQVTLLFSEIAISGGSDGLALAQIVAERWPHIEIVLASELVEPDLSGDLRLIEAKYQCAGADATLV